jgi:DNA polymerase-3 subunit beta
MKFTVARDDLLASLQKVIGVIERKQTRPILSNVLMQLADGALVITGTDLEIQLVTRTVVSTKEVGEITTPARKFMDICRLLPEQSRLAVELKADQRLHISSGRGRFTLTTLPAGSFPQFSSREYETEFRIDLAHLKRTLGKTLFCMALQDVRQFLNGLLLEIERDRVEAVATDGHRMAIYHERLTGPIEAARALIIPRKSVIELYRLLDESDQLVTVEIASNSMRVTTDDIVFSTKLIEGKYPEFRHSIPATATRCISVDKQAFREALSRVEVLCNEQFKGVRLNIASGLMQIHAQNPEQEAAEEEVEIGYDGSPFAVGFNVSYILEAVSNIDSNQVSLSFSDTHSCCVIEDPQDDKLKFIVMPIHL